MATSSPQKGAKVASDVEKSDLNARKQLNFEVV
jgi:hypothetical protein